VQQTTKARHCRQLNPGDWKHRPILVSNNVEWPAVARCKAQMSAKKHKIHVLKWKAKDTSYVNKPNANDLATVNYNKQVHSSDNYLFPVSQFILTTM